MQWENEIYTPYKPESHFIYKNEIEDKLINRNDSKISKLFQSYIFSISFFLIIFMSLFSLIWLLTTDSGYDEYGQWNRGDVGVIVACYIGIAIVGIFIGWATAWSLKYKSKTRALNNIDKFALFKKYTSNIEGLSLNDIKWGVYSETAGNFIEPQIKGCKFKISKDESFLINGSFKNINFEFTVAKWLLKFSFGSFAGGGMYNGSFGYNNYINRTPNENFVSQIVIKDDIFNSFNETNILPSATFLNPGATTINVPQSEKIKFANDNFNSLFSVFGDGVNIYKLFNATEQENYIELYKMFPYASIQINEGAMYITFPTPESFRKKHNFEWKEYRSDAKEIEKQLLESITKFFQAFSYFTILRKVQK